MVLWESWSSLRSLSLLSLGSFNRQFDVFIELDHSLMRVLIGVHLRVMSLLCQFSKGRSLDCILSEGLCFRGKSGTPHSVTDFNAGKNLIVSWHLLRLDLAPVSCADFHYSSKVHRVSLPSRVDLGNVLD